METRRIVWKSSGLGSVCIYIYMYIRLRIFTTSTRVRLHTWRLGLTALILKNCHLSPDDLLFTPRASSSSCSSLSGSFNRSRHPYASPRHPSHRGTKLRRFAPFRANFSTDFSSRSVETPLPRPRINPPVETREVGPFAEMPIRLDVTKWQSLEFRGKLFGGDKHRTRVTGESANHSRFF